jgi:hypothetical protein
MSGDRSRERRQLAAERLIFAQQMADWKIRASVLGMTQRWLDLAEPREPDTFDKALRLRAIQTKFGQKLRAHYEPPEELPHGILTLLMQLNAPQDGETGNRLLWYFRFAQSLGKTPPGLSAFRAGARSSYNVSMKQFVVESGDFVATTGIYRMVEHPEREITLVYGDSVPTFQRQKVKFRLIRAAKNPRRGWAEP